MITLINGNFQNAQGQPLNGSLVLQPTADAQAIVSPGQVVGNVPIVFQIVNGNLAGSCKIYSGAELTPSIQYQVNILDQNGSRLTNPILWNFTQPAGSTVDVGTMLSQQGGPSLSFLLGQITVPFSATPAFAGPASGFIMTLAGNVTSSTWTGGAVSQIITFKIIQSAAGNNTFAWPPNIIGAESISPTSNSINTQSFYFDGTNAYPIGPMTVN
jgi:hypothetical protein